MAQATLTRILAEIDRMELDELRQIQNAVQAKLTPNGYSHSEEEVLRGMLKAGLIAEIKPKPALRKVERPLVSIQGEPLSETIIEERR